MGEDIKRPCERPKTSQGGLVTAIIAVTRWVSRWGDPKTPPGSGGVLPHLPGPPWAD